MNNNPNEKQSQSQTAQILAYLKEGNKLTPIEALKLCGCFRLSARIANLRDKGYNIKSELVTLENGKRVAEYEMITCKTCSGYEDCSREQCQAGVPFLQFDEYKTCAGYLNPEGGAE